MEVATDANHIQHNILPLNLDADPQEEIITASKEGLYAMKRGASGTWSRTLIGEGAPGEVKLGRVARPADPRDGRALARQVDRDLRRASPACGPGRSSNRSSPADMRSAGPTSTATAATSSPPAGATRRNRAWRSTPSIVKARCESKTLIDDGGMATEDLVVADLNGDKRPDIVASGRATRNVKIYWNETGKSGSSAGL